MNNLSENLFTTTIVIREPTVLTANTFTSHSENTSLKTLSNGKTCNSLNTPNNALATESNHLESNSLKTSGYKLQATPTRTDEETKQRRDTIKKELSRMKQREEKAAQKEKARRKKEDMVAVARMRQEKMDEGVTMFLQAADSKRSMRKFFSEEMKLSLHDKRKTLEAESLRIKSSIGHRLGIYDIFPKGKKMVTLAADFYNSDDLPNKHFSENIRKELTSTEISDLRLVFDMFDVENKGYITADDLKRAAGILGYTAKKQVFQEMITDALKDKKDCITFINFLELVIQLQGDGPDSYDDIVQFFHLLDQEDKGFVSFSDVRKAADDLKVPLSNRAIREMLEEADRTGDGEISLSELVHILEQTGKFKATATLLC